MGTCKMQVKYSTKNEIPGLTGLSCCKKGLICYLQGAALFKLSFLSEFYFNFNRIGSLIAYIDPF